MASPSRRGSKPGEAWGLETVLRRTRAGARSPPILWMMSNGPQTTGQGVNPFSPWSRPSDCGLRSCCVIRINHTNNSNARVSAAISVLRGLFLPLRTARKAKFTLRTSIPPPPPGCDTASDHSYLKATPVDQTRQDLRKEAEGCTGSVTPSVPPKKALVKRGLKMASTIEEKPARRADLDSVSVSDKKSGSPDDARTTSSLAREEGEEIDYHTLPWW